MNSSDRAGLHHLRALPKLMIVTVRDTRVTNADIVGLERETPEPTVDK
jgi:hypothetical protein